MYDREQLHFRNDIGSFCINEDASILTEVEPFLSSEPSTTELRMQVLNERKIGRLWQEISSQDL